MNDPLLVLNKLGELSQAATEASEEADKAAIFAAVHILVNNFQGLVSECFIENLECIRSSISAILGYDIDNDQSREQHLSSALESLEILRQAY